MIIGGKKFENYTFVMAIINLTPDSFYPESRTNADNLLFKVEKAEKEGAALIDLGAQSTRPGYVEVPPDEEIERLLKPLTLIKRNFGLSVSVDTYFPEVAEEALKAGADMINDIWGLSRGDGMAETVAKYGASVCIMHNAKTQLIGDVLGQVGNFLKEAADRAVNAGIAADKICLDGGIGFAKDREQCLNLLQNYGGLKSLGYPLLLGASRKSLFGGKAEDRLPATLDATRLAAKEKVLFVRVHDVKENVGAIKEVYGY